MTAVMLPLRQPRQREKRPHSGLLTVDRSRSCNRRSGRRARQCWGATSQSEVVRVRSCLAKVSQTRLTTKIVIIAASHAT